MNPNEKDPTHYKCYVEAPQVTLYNIDLYLTPHNDLESADKEYKKTYLKYVQDIFDIAFGDNHEYRPEDVFECEKRLIELMDCNVISPEAPDGYNVVSIRESVELLQFDFEQFARSIGFQTIPQDFISSNVSYIKCVVQLLSKDNTWKNKQWLTFILGFAVSR